MCRAGDAGVKGAHHPPDGAFQFQVDAVGGDVALRGHPQGALDGQHVVHGGDDELALRDHAVFDDIVMDERPARRFHQPLALAVARRVGHVRVFIVQRRFQQHFDGALNGIDQLDAAAQVKQQDGVGRVAKLARRPAAGNRPPVGCPCGGSCWRAPANWRASPRPGRRCARHRSNRFPQRSGSSRKCAGGEGLGSTRPRGVITRIGR